MSTSSSLRKQTIAILGTRGIPAHYGGFETFAEELGVRLVEKGYHVRVYCRKGNTDFQEKFYKGIELIVLPTLRHKYLDTIFHAFLSTIHVLFTDTDIVYYCNAINSVFTLLPRIFGKKTLINVDGLEWKRAKWHPVGKFAYVVSEWLATFFASQIITDSRGIKAYYKEKFKKDTRYISYGAKRVETPNAEEILQSYGLTPRGYLLYVSRLEPENNAHIMIEAYEKIQTDLPLVIVGDAPYAASYIQYLKRTQDKRIKFLGGIYGEHYYALKNNAYLYLHGNEVGGTNPALLQAMVSGNCVVVNGISFNQEVIAEAGVCFAYNKVSDLRERLEHLLQNPQDVEQYRVLARKRAEECYSWEKVVDDYDLFFKELMGN